MVTLSSINKEAKKYGLRLIRGKGYYYWSGINSNTTNKLARLESTGVYGLSINNNSWDQWMRELDDIKSKLNLNESSRRIDKIFPNIKVNGKTNIVINKQGQLELQELEKKSNSSNINSDFESLMKFNIYPIVPKEKVTIKRSSEIPLFWLVILSPEIYFVVIKNSRFMSHWLLYLPNHILGGKTISYNDSANFNLFVRYLKENLLSNTEQFELYANKYDETAPNSDDYNVVISAENTINMMSKLYSKMSDSDKKKAIQILKKKKINPIFLS